jgi:hypothetical protein
MKKTWGSPNQPTKLPKIGDIQLSLWFANYDEGVFVFLPGL